MLIQDKEKSPIDVGASTDCMKKSFNDSIPQSATTKHLVIEMESTKLRDPIGLDSFPLGTVRSFRLYLKAQLIFLRAGIIAP